MLDRAEGQGHLDVLRDFAMPLDRRIIADMMGLPLEQMVLWDPFQPYGGLTDEQIRNAKIILWRGFCSVHQMFQPAHIDNFRGTNPGGKVISHPENSWEVCQKSDFVGSTEYILRTVRASQPGDHWLVGTELNLVNRLHNEMKDKGVTIHFMSPMVCMCSTMFRIDPQHLAWTLENLAEGRVVNQIKVPDEVARNAKLAVERMLAV